MKMALSGKINVMLTPMVCNDLISGDEGNDVLYGGAGNDSVWAGEGDDMVKNLASAGATDSYMWRMAA